MRLSVLTLLTMYHVSGTTSAPRPHIIMIVADDLGWDDVSFHGSPHIPTPNIDALANGGVILNSHYVSPICTPTRASLMTGKHPIKLGLQHGTIFGTQPLGLPLTETTTPQYLKTLGYDTHCVGKWHLGFFEKEYTPTYRGFDSFFGFYTGKTDYWDHQSYEDFWGLDLRDNMKPVTNETNHYNTELFTEVAERIITTHNSSNPLFLYIAHQAVHTGNLQNPLQAPKRLKDKFSYFVSKDRQTNAAMVASLDESVGNITKALKHSGLFSNSVIVFITDNGGAPRGFDWSEGCNYPFKGGKDTLWEGGVRGIGFVHSNLINMKSRVSFELIDVTDWLPTFYHLAGGDVTQIEDKIDGINVWDTISNGAPSPRTEVLHNVDEIRKFAAIRVKNFKLVVNQDAVYNTTWHPRYDIQGVLTDSTRSSTLPGAEIDCGLTGGNEIVPCDTNSFPCLFDISTDPCEYKNIAHTNLPKVRELLNKILEYQKKAVPPWYPERDPLANPALHDNVWSPWQVHKTDQISSPNDGKKVLADADVPDHNYTVDQVNGSHLLDCCAKYYDVPGFNFRDNSANKTEQTSGSYLAMVDCCHGNVTYVDVKEAELENCCLSNRPTFAEYVVLQTEKDKEVYNLIHEILDLPETSKRKAITRPKKRNKQQRFHEKPSFKNKRARA